MQIYAEFFAKLYRKNGNINKTLECLNHSLVCCKHSKRKNMFREMSIYLKLKLTEFMEKIF